MMEAKDYESMKKEMLHFKNKSMELALKLEAERERVKKVIDKYTDDYGVINAEFLKKELGYDGS